MTSKSYFQIYLKIYFWQAAAFILRFVSLFIVTPNLTKDPTTYGIYAVCISVTIFLNYADMGFLRSGQKYAAEYYVKGDRNEEMKYIGFGAFVLLIFTSICSIIFFYYAFHPDGLIKGLDTPDKTRIASQLLLILAFFTPATVLQRISSMIFDIRLDSYIYQRLSLLSSLTTICSAFYFFRSGSYDIIGYFLFSQSINLFMILASMVLAKHMYSYDPKIFFRHVRFDSIVYQRAKGLAYSGLYIIVMWIFFYELDQIVIAKYLGASKVAIYAIAFSFTSLFRSIYGILFSPFMIRSNHFVGNNDDDGLKRFCLQLVSLCAPLFVLPTIAFVIVAKPFILSWVGEGYEDSISLTRYLPLTFSMAFISYSTNIFLIAKERIKEMYIIATLQPVVYWVGVFLTYSYFNLLSFGIFKFIATIIAEAYCLYILINFLKISFKDFLKIIYPILLPALFLVVVLSVANEYLPIVKSKSNLIIVIFTTVICILISFVIQYYSSAYIRTTAQNLFRSVFSNNLSKVV